MKVVLIRINNEHYCKIKDLRQAGDKSFIKYKFTNNKLPYKECEIVKDGKGNAIIIDDNMAVIGFNEEWLNKL